MEYALNKCFVLSIQGDNFLENYQVRHLSGFQAILQKYAQNNLKLYLDEDFSQLYETPKDLILITDQEYKDVFSQIVFRQKEQIMIHALKAEQKNADAQFFTKTIKDMMFEYNHEIAKYQNQSLDETPYQSNKVVIQLSAMWRCDKDRQSLGPKESIHIQGTYEIQTNQKISLIYLVVLNEIDPNKKTQFISTDLLEQSQKRGDRYYTKFQVKKTTQKSQKMQAYLAIKYSNKWYYATQYLFNSIE